MHFWRRVGCHYSFMHENLMDMNHQFLHRGIMGRIKPTLLDYQSGPDWVEARYRFQDTPGSRPDRRSRLLLLAGRDRAPSAGRRRWPVRRQRRHDHPHAVSLSRP